MPWTDGSKIGTVVSGRDTRADEESERGNGSRPVAGRTGPRGRKSAACQRAVRPRMPAHACSYAAGVEGREFPPTSLICGRVRTGSLGASQQTIHHYGENVLRTPAFWCCHRVHGAAASISSDLALLRYPSCCTDTSRNCNKHMKKTTKPVTKSCLFHFIRDRT